MPFVSSTAIKLFRDRYMPILPMALVNGADGIGTGWSTSVPNYNPRDIVVNLQRRLQGEEFIPMHPWYRGFKVYCTHCCSYSIL